MSSYVAIGSSQLDRLSGEMTKEERGGRDTRTSLPLLVVVMVVLEQMVLSLSLSDSLEVESNCESGRFFHDAIS